MLERNFVVIGGAMRRLPKDQLLFWPRQLPSFAVNVTVNEDLSVSPYEVEHGRVPRMPFDTQFIEPLQEGDEGEH